MIKSKQLIESGSRVRIVVSVNGDGVAVCALLNEVGEVLATAPRARALADLALDCGVKEVKFDFDLGAHNV